MGDEVEVVNQGWVPGFSIKVGNQEWVPKVVPLDGSLCWDSQLVQWLGHFVGSHDWPPRLGPKVES